MLLVGDYLEVPQMASVMSSSEVLCTETCAKQTSHLVYYHIFSRRIIGKESVGFYLKQGDHLLARLFI